jgi:tetratricopeptide (TPR) repeat protein
MKRRWLRIGILAVAIALVATAAGLWRRSSVRAETLRESVPARPALTGFPAEFARRVTACEQLVRDRTGGLSPLGELAALYQANGFLIEASQCYRGLLRLDPANPRWPHLLAGIYADYGQLEAALALWRRVTQLAPDYLPARIRMGDVLLKLDRGDEAAAAYSAALGRDANNPFALLGLARIDVAAKRWAQARARLEPAARQTGFKIGGDLLATVYEQLGERDQAAAIRARGKSSGAFYDIPDPWKDGLMEDCFDVYRLSVAGGFAAHRGDRPTALRLLKRAISLAPDNAQTYFQIGLLELEARDYDQARRHFEACVARDPGFSDGWAQLYGVCRTLGDDAAAVRALDQGLAHCPQSPGLHLSHARRLAAAGEWDGAVGEYNEVIRLRPNEAGPFVELAGLYFHRDRVSEGIALLHQALAGEPDFPPALGVLALYSINGGDETVAKKWMLRARRQVRMPRAQMQALVAQYRRQFGHEPW